MWALSCFTVVALLIVGGAALAIWMSITVP